MSYHVTQILFKANKTRWQTWKTHQRKHGSWGGIKRVCADHNRLPPSLRRQGLLQMGHPLCCRGKRRPGAHHNRAASGPVAMSILRMKEPNAKFNTNNLTKRLYTFIFFFKCWLPYCCNHVQLLTPTVLLFQSHQILTITVLLLQSHPTFDANCHIVAITSNFWCWLSYCCNHIEFWR